MRRLCRLVFRNTHMQRERAVTDRAGNSDPFQGRVELEWKHQDIDPGNLSNGNTVGHRKWCIQHTLGSSEDFIQGTQSTNWWKQISNPIQNANGPWQDGDLLA